MKLTLGNLTRHSAAPPFVPSALDPSNVVGRAWTFSESNRFIADTTASTTPNGYVRSLGTVASGKARVELTPVANSDAAMPGIGVCGTGSQGSFAGAAAASAVYFNTGEIFQNGSALVSGLTMVMGLGNPFAVELDADTGTVRWKDSSGATFSLTVGFGGPYKIILATRNSGAQMRVNFGNAAWGITPTAGYEQGW